MELSAPRPGALPTRKEPLVSLKQISKWSPGPMQTHCRGGKFLPLSGNEPRFRCTALCYPGWWQYVVIFAVLTSRWDRRTTNPHYRHGRCTGIQNVWQEIWRDERKCRWEDATKTDPKMKLRLRMWCGLQLRTHYWKRSITGELSPTH